MTNIFSPSFTFRKIKFDVKEKFPRKAENLSQNQKKLLVKITHILEKPGDPEKFQNEIYQGGKDLGLSSTETFTAIYLSLLGKESGPKAAWLILSLDKDFVKRRFIEAAK